MMSEVLSKANLLGAAITGLIVFGALMLLSPTSIWSIAVIGGLSSLIADFVVKKLNNR